MTSRVAIPLAALLAVACGRKSVPVAADASAPTPIQCWRRSGMKPPGTRPATAKALLAKGAMRVYFDPKRPGVVVPPRYREDLRVVFVFGNDASTTKPEDESLSGTLSLDGQATAVRIPWPAVYALTSDQDDAASGGVWEESVPEALFCKD